MASHPSRKALQSPRQELPAPEMQASKEPFEQLIESAPDGMVVVDGQGRIRLVNARTEELFGYARSELLGQPVELLIPMELRDRHADHRRAYVERPWPRRMGAHPDLFCRRKDGSDFPAEISLSPIRTVDGMLVYAAIRDISERKQAQAQIQANLHMQTAISGILSASLEAVSLEELLKRALDLLLAVPWLALHSKGSIFLIEDDPNTLVLKVHRGFPPEQSAIRAAVPLANCLCGKTAGGRELVFAPRVSPDHELRYPGMIPHGHYWVPLISGSELLGVLNLYVPDGHKPMPDEHRFLSAIADTLAGTVQRRRAEEALRESEERFALAVQGTDAGIWDWDLRTGALYFSPRWKSMLGYAPDEIRGGFEEWVSRLHPEDRHRALTAVRDYLEGRSREYELEHRLRHKDGSYRLIVARGAAVRDETGRPYRMVGSHLDVTERRQAEESLRDTQVKLLAAQVIQRHLLPSVPPAVPGFDIAGACYPAELTGGDYFDYLELEDGSLGLVIADVMGHGFGAALLMATTHAYLRALAGASPQIEHIATRANAHLCKALGGRSFVSLLLGRLVPREGLFWYVNAGHPPGYVMDASGAVKAELASTSLPLGVAENEEFFVSTPIALNPGDVVVLFTDGVLEAESPTGVPLGSKRMLEIISQNRHGSAGQVIESIHQAVLDFSKPRRPVDDQTLIVVKVCACRTRQRTMASKTRGSHRRRSRPGTRTGSPKARSAPGRER